MSSAHSYEVLGKLAEGESTEIFLARAKGGGSVERFVVLKRLKRAVTTQLHLVELFLDEARLASQLQHPNIAQVFEVGKLGGSYFFAMEFVNGETLKSLVEHARSKKMQVPVRAVLTIASAVAAGLHHAHARVGADGEPLYIVHGEVTAANTLVSQDGIVKLVDFGITRAGERGMRNVSQYTAPEQCWGQPIDRRTDLYSLGVMMWELITLEPLFERATPDETRLAIETEKVLKPSTKRYDVPPELDALVMKLLAKEPSDRFQDADELLAAIETVAQKLSILLSTADLSRMVRLWFGTKSDPTIDPSAPDPVQPVVVDSERIPEDLSRTGPSAIDVALDAVRSAAALITTRATERAGSNTGRQDQATVPPELMDNPNENFEQIRDRILARARQKKETARQQLAGSARPASDSVASGAPVNANAPVAAADDRHTRQTALPPLGQQHKGVEFDPHTRKTTPAQFRRSSDAMLAGLADGMNLGSNGLAKRKDDSPDAPDKVVVDTELGARGTSGSVGAKAPRRLASSRRRSSCRAAREAGDDDDDADLAEVRAAMAASRAAKAGRDAKTEAEPETKDTKPAAAQPRRPSRQTACRRRTASRRPRLRAKRRSRRPSESRPRARARPTSCASHRRGRRG